MKAKERYLTTIKKVCLMIIHMSIQETQIQNRE